MSAVLDIAVNIFGTGGGGRGDNWRRSSSGSTGSVDRSGLGGHEDGLVTFTIDVPTGGSTSLGITVKELGGGAVFVEVMTSPLGFPDVCFIFFVPR